MFTSRGFQFDHSPLAAPAPGRWAHGDTPPSLQRRRTSTSLGSYLSIPTHMQSLHPPIAAGGSNSPHTEREVETPGWALLRCLECDIVRCFMIATK